jgi:beta-xylosidase
MKLPVPALALCALSLVLTLPAGAGEVIRPDIREPLRDAAVCAAGDRGFYLTGTVATTLPGETAPSFENCRGVKVWKSSDLKSWEEVGLVWDLWKDPVDPKKGNPVGWQTELLPVPGLPSGVRARGMTAPRLAFDGSRFWITHSMNGYAAAAMPGTADVRGPYAGLLPLVEAGGAPTARSDATLFLDTDGTRYLVWGGGCIARLKSPEELMKLPDSETGVEAPVHYLPALTEDFAGDDAMPDRGAPYGPALFVDQGRYRFIFTATTLRNGAAHEDAYLCEAGRLLGPYSKPRLLIPDAGRCVPFRGPDGSWRLSFSNTDNQPVISPCAPAPAPPATPAPKPGPVTIAAAVPPRRVSQKPADVPQIIEMVEPCLDRPLRDAALCRGPDGAWYLTGTEGALTPDGTIDWTRNNGIHLWTSTDRKTWTDLGYVWNIDRDAPASPRSAWHLDAHLDLTCGADPRVGRAMTAPEIHYLKDTFWIVYSMNGSGIGLLKSESGNAAGPYRDMGRIVAHARDGSLFEDEDGTVYLVWGQGFAAPMNDAMDAVAGPVKTFFTNTRWYPRELRRPELMGQWGSHLVKQGDWYVWSFTTRTGRGGINAIDTMASWSRSLDGPWGEPCIVLLNGGQSTLVADGEGGWLATVSGEDEYSQCPFQPAITPVGSGNGGKLFPLRPYPARTSVSQWHAIVSHQATELDLWIGFPDLLGTELRDVFIMRDGDTYYACGTPWGDSGKYFKQVVLFRSTDLIHWTRLENLYSVDQLLKDGVARDKERLRDAIEKDKKADKRLKDTIKMGETKLAHIDGHWYIIWHCCGGPGIGCYLLQSEGDDVRGPWRAVETVALGDFYENAPNQLLWISPALWISSHDSIEAFIKDSRLPWDQRPERRPVDFVSIPNICVHQDCEMGLAEIAGKYVFWSTDWTGGYDLNYMFADDWKGPWRGKLRVLPHGGNGAFFHDTDGNPWYAYFTLNTNEWTTRSRLRVRFNLMPLAVRHEDGELIIEPRAMVANRARLEKLGALWQSPRPKP